MSKLYEQDNMKIYNADCMTVMNSYPDNYFDLAVVDPPYGINMDRGLKGEPSIDKRDGKKIHRKDYVGDWDSDRPSKDYFNELIRVSKNCIIWGGNFFADLLPPSTHWVYWDKHNPMPTFGDGELAYTNLSKKSIKKVSIPYWGHQTAGEKSRIHPTQKPIKLYNWIYANYAEPVQKILDTHLGSGSNAIAAHYAKMSEFVGCELDEDYYKAAIDRIRKETRQLELF